MALPASRTNLALDPAATALTNWGNLGSTTSTRSINTVTFHSGTTSYKTVYTAAGTGGSKCTVANPGFATGDTVKWSVWVYPSKTITLQPYWERTSPTYTGGSGGAAVSCPANTWTQLTGTLTMTAAQADATSTGYGFGFLSTAAWAINDVTYTDEIIVERNVTALTTYFDGNTPLMTGGNYSYKWSGTANASTSVKDYYGIWAEQVAAAGAPRVQVTAVGLGGTAVTTQVTRKAGRETWSVPGWKKRNTLSGETYTDVTPPLGRPVTYTLISNGLTINTMTITVTSTTGWVQDPLNPESAMPVETTADGGPAILALSKAALKRLSYGAVYEEETPLGGQYPIVRANDRQGASGVEFHLNAYSNVTSDALQQLVMDTPIILFRGLPSWGSIPALAYLVGDVEEAPFNRARGGQFTAWVAAGKLAAPVSLGPLTGSVTNQMVQDNLTGRTNASIQSTSATQRNIDVQANPLGLGQ